jgi:hypothetical protein
MSALAVVTVVLTTTEASAMLKDPGIGAAAAAATADEWPDEGSGYPGSGAKSPENSYPDYDPQHHGNMTTPEPSHSEYNYPGYKFDVPTSPASEADASARLAPDPGPGSATTPGCHWSYHPACEEGPVPVPPVEAALAPRPSDDKEAEIMRLGVSALGGAGIALGAVWIYRRRQAVNGPAVISSEVVPPGGGESV